MKRVRESNLHKLPKIGQWLASALCASLLIGCAGNSSSSGDSHSSPSAQKSSSSLAASSASSPSSSSAIAHSSASAAVSSAPTSDDCAWQSKAASLQTQGITRIEAEHYDTCTDSFSDTTNGNSGGALRDDDVDITALTSASNGFYVSQMAAGEYLRYSVQVDQAGFYNISLRVLPDAQTSPGFRIAARDADNSALLNADSQPEWQDTAGYTLYLSDGPQTLQLALENGAAAVDYIELNYAENPAQSPQTVVTNMGIGINLGNTLDAYPNEGDWAPAAQPQYLKAFSDAGFKHVRIPVTWGSHVATTAPYTIDASFLDRVEQVVDWALSQDLYVVVNAHHETWLKENYGIAANRARFDAIWQQLAERLQYKPARLMFEILNEPNGMTQTEVDELNTRILAIIRNHNPNRIVVFSGNGYTPVDSLIKANVPNDPALIGNFHSYDPWAFAGQCTRGWGSAQDYTELAAIYDKAKSWSEQHGVPVMVNEFGAAHYDYTKPQNICNNTARLNYLQAHVQLALERGIAATAWDDAGAFKIYDRVKDTWGAEQAVLVSGN